MKNLFRQKEGKLWKRLQKQLLESNIWKRQDSIDERGPLRLYSDVDALNVQDPYSCTESGETVKLDQNSGQDSYVCTDNDLITQTKIDILKVFRFLAFFVDTKW